MDRGQSSRKPVAYPTTWLGEIPRDHLESCQADELKNTTASQPVNDSLPGYGAILLWHVASYRLGVDSQEIVGSTLRLQPLCENFALRN